MVVEGKRPKKPAKQPERKPPTARITKIASLKRFPDKDYANALLHDVAKAVAPLMHENNFKVGLLCEMFPKSGNLLGLNINGGSKIMLRLRYHSNSKSFLPMGDIIGTMLHELTHNLYGRHDQKFYEFLDKLKSRFEQIQYNPTTVQGYICEENKLGGNIAFGGYSSIRDKRLKVLESGKFKAERRRLGGSSNKNASVRMLALEAAQRRLADSKWCNDGEKEDAEPDNSELEIISMGEVIDLTGDDTEHPGGLPNEMSNEPHNGPHNEIPNSNTSNDDGTGPEKHHKTPEVWVID